MIAWAVEALIASTLLMLVVLMLRAPVRRLFGPDCAYALWLLPVARLLLPPMPGAGQWSRLVAPLTDWLGHGNAVASPALLPARIAAQAVPEVQVIVMSAAPPAAMVPPAAIAGVGAPVAALLLALWLAGAVLFVGWHVRRHGRFIRTLLSTAKVREHGPIQVIESDAAAGPLAFGIWRKYVAFPRDFSERYDEDEQVLALAHEMTHHARGDLIANWVALVVLGLHWFNPIAWRAFRAFRADQEMACDARVLAGRDQRLRHAYGRAIVKSAHGGWVSAACHLHSINELKGRLRMLSNYKLTRWQSRAGLTLAGAMLLAGLGATASGTPAVAQLRDGMRSATGVDLARIGQQPPAPPAPGVATAPVPPSAAAPAPEPPAAPDAPVKTAKRVKIVLRDKDGKVQVIEPGPDADLDAEIAKVMPNGRMDISVPEIVNKRCDGKGQTVTQETTKKGERRIIICTNRIAAMTAEANARVAEANARIIEFRSRNPGAGSGIQMVRVDTAEIQRNAYRSALDGLRKNRAAMVANPELTGTAREQALQAVDQAIAELERDAARVN